MKIPLYKPHKLRGVNWQQPQDVCGVYKREGRRITIEPTESYPLENESGSLRMAAKVGRG